MQKPFKRPLIQHPDRPELTLVPLGGKHGIGHFAVVDTKFAAVVGAHNWCACRRSTVTYVTTSVVIDGRPTSLRLHRLIGAELGFDPFLDVDHEDHDGLNNTERNLRSATRVQNTRNQQLRANNTSGVKGVYWDSYSGKWKAQLSILGKITHLGRFADLAEATEMVRARRAQTHGEFACHGMMSTSADPQSSSNDGPL